MACATVIGFTSCEDQPDKYSIASGTPEVFYARPVDVLQADSLLDGAYMDATICLVGNNLRSITEMYFNNVQAILNTSFITDHTLIVTVPGEIPSLVSNKIYMINNSKDTTTFDFKVIVPGPVVKAMGNEYANAGEKVSIIGNYFVDDPNLPLIVKIGGKEAKVESISLNEVVVTVPEGAAEGAVEVSTIYGNAKSTSFLYRDSRGMITNFDGEGNTGTKGIVPQGWNLAVTYSDVDGIDGYYAQVGNGELTMPADGGWTEGFKISWWCGNWSGDPMAITEGAGVPLRNIFPAGYFAQPEKLALKFELFIPSSNPWKAGAMQVLFMNYLTAANDSWQNNTYIQKETGLCRGLYRPWSMTGSFDTGDKWITVTMPISDFTYNMDGTTGTVAITEESFDSFTIWPLTGGEEGVECQPIFRYDNIRIVPIK